MFSYRPRSRQMRHIKGVFAAFLTSFALSCAAQTVVTKATLEAAGMSSADFSLLSTMLHQHVDDGRVAGLVAGVARNGHTVYLESMGWQNVEDRSAMQDASIFQIRSMSKPITSLAIMQLIESGQIGLHDSVSKYIPTFADMTVFTNPDDPDNSPTHAPSRQITIEDLLTHMGGISHRDGALYQSRQVRSRSDTLAQLVDKLVAVPLMAEPGTRWIYSESTTVLGRIVELVSGQSFDDYLVEHIFAPLQMTDTGFYVSADKVDRLARIYQTPRNGNALIQVPEMEVPITMNPPLLEGSAGMVSTVADYLRFLQVFLNGGELDGQRVLGTELINAMTQNHVPAAALPIGLSPQNPMLALGWGYGFTVVIDAAQSDYAVNNGEFGWNGSLGTFSWADPETNTVAILMMQIVPSGAYSLSGKFKTMVAQTIVGTVADH